MVHSPSRTGLLAALIVLGSVALAVSTGATPDPAKDKGQSKVKSGDLPAVITNDVLNRMFGTVDAEEDTKTEVQAGTATSSAAQPDVKWDPLKAMEEGRQRAADRQAQIAEAEKKVADAEATVRDLEKRVLAYRNPLLPRPEVSSEEADAQAGMNGGQRVGRAEQQLAEARSEAERARADLARVRSGS